LGDHGPRLDDLRYKTEIGEIEDRNPFFMLSVPETIQKDDKLMKVLQSNSNQLLTHLDIYETLIEIGWIYNKKVVVTHKSGSRFHDFAGEGVNF
jgi:ribulose-5-phosphate 4-epimerase/fuculose-1-phosphate aldolase